MSIRHDLVRRLADGAFHSGTQLGDELGVTRAAVHKAVQEWTERGIKVESVVGRGYRLDRPFIPLAASAIEELLAGAGIQVPVDVLPEVDSTNRHLAGTPGPGPRACIAESQLAGRGRRGRQWIATPYRNILMSVRFEFDAVPAELSALGLAAGVAVSRALEDFGVHGVGLKWPNDLVWQGRKLGGLLIDVRGESGGPTVTVSGLGLNVDLSLPDSEQIDQPHAALVEILPRPIDRNRLAALLISELLSVYARFAADGFTPFHEDWEQRHINQNRQVVVSGAGEATEGIAVGVDSRGALRVRDPDGNIRHFYTGEVSLRARPS